MPVLIYAFRRSPFQWASYPAETCIHWQHRLLANKVETRPKIRLL